MSGDEKRPKADPKAGLWVYGYSVTASPDRYRYPEVRKVTEEMCRTLLKDRKGLEATWGEWRFVPESEHEDETGETVTLPALWLYTCEALGPAGLNS